MGHIKTWFLSLSLKKAFVCLVFFMMILVAVLSACVISAGMSLQNRLLDEVKVPLSSVIQQEPETNLDEIQASKTMVVADDDQISEDENGQLILITMEHRLQNLSSRKRIIYYGVGIAMVAIPCLLFAIGTIFCAWIFYSIKLKKPLSLLMQSADHISQNELEFLMDYDSSDEMGQLCSAMDKMHSSLHKNNQEMWAMMEERRKLNASIAHDLRTPLTVMKGYTEYLSNNVPLGRISETKLLETIANLAQATERMEAYVNQVRDIQALDAVPVRVEPISLCAFLEQQEKKYVMLARTHHLCFVLIQRELHDVLLSLDKNLVERIIDNVISNSMRYAKEQISMEVSYCDNILSLCICDDGPGFSGTALKSATSAFYKENSENDHFGLGLSICDTLCRKLGGTLTLKNGENGGACVVLTITTTNPVEDIAE